MKCPRCGSCLYIIYDEPNCFQCGYVDYSYVPPQTPKKKKGTKGRKPLAIPRIESGVKELDTLEAEMEIVGGRQYMYCPFCRRVLRPVSKTKRQYKEFPDFLKYQCITPHTIFFKSTPNGEFDGWTS
jgi:hypothetical protein